VEIINRQTKEFSNYICFELMRVICETSIHDLMKYADAVSWETERASGIKEVPIHNFSKLTYGESVLIS